MKVEIATFLNKMEKEFCEFCERVHKTKKGKEIVKNACKEAGVSQNE